MCNEVGKDCDEQEKEGPSHIRSMTSCCLITLSPQFYNVYAVIALQCLELHEI